VSNDLGGFLKAARARVEPADAGLPGGITPRRVPGLRREEVAALAGVSADYYARLEQGRERHPSAQVTDAVARALRLTGDARGHLYRLAGLTPALRADPAGEEVHPQLRRLLESFPGSAAYVLSPALDVLAANRTAEALLSPFGTERNMPRILFRHPEAEEVFTDRELLRGATVHALRLNAGRFPGHPGIRDLVTSLSAESRAFRELWADQRVGALPRAFKVFHHPVVGRVELTYQTFDVADAPGQVLHVGTPEPASRGLVDALPVLEDLRDAWSAALGPALVGLYVHGSLVAGDFAADRSDLDVLAVLAAEPVLADLRPLHEALDRRHPWWAGRIEVEYVPVHPAPGSLIARISPGEALHLLPATVHRLVTWASVRDDGRTLFGPPPCTLLPAADPERVRAALLDHVRDWPQWVETMTAAGAQAYSVLTMCRAVQRLVFDRQLSKLRAADRTVETHPGWAGLITWARDWWYAGGAADDPGRFSSVREFVVRISAEILEYHRYPPG
jgi:transcriptional regulator with XRE-family HTH domain